MKKILLILAVWLIPLILIGQETSLYNENGTLKADTTLAIGQDALEIWRKHEDRLLRKLAQNFEYTDIASDVQLEGLSIIKITIDRNGEPAYEMIKAIGGGLEEETIRLIEKIKIPDLLKSNDERELMYYLPVQFEIRDLKSFADSTGRLLLLDTEYPFIIID